MQIADTLITGVVCLAILAPLLFIFVLIAKPKSYGPLKLFVLFFFIRQLITLLLRYDLIPRVPWNWEAALISIAAALICIAFSPYSFKDAGLSLQFKKNWGILFIVALGYYLLQLMMDRRITTHHHYPAGVLAFQATVSGLADEIWFRGIYLLLFNELLGRPVQIGKFQCGAAVLITAALFAITNGVNVHHLQVSVHWGNMKSPLVYGLLWALVAEAAGNIWPAVFLHNLSNTFKYLLSPGR